MQEKDKLITIAFVDDHILLRDALASVINAFNNCRITILAANGEEFIQKLDPASLPRLVILDLNMPLLDGYETVKWLTANHPQIPILILTMYHSEISLIRLLQAGVRGFLKKDIHPGELQEAIESVIHSGYYYSSNSTNKLMNMLKNNTLKNAKPVTVVLTDKELEFLKWVSTDMTYKEIAHKMEISPRTVDNYRDSLFIKLNVKSRVALAIYTIQSGIVNLPY